MNEQQKTIWHISKLKNWPDNPREIKEDKYKDLKDSLKQEGQLMPLLVDTRSDHLGEVIGGNMTLRALTELGIEDVWVEPRTPRDDAHAFELAIKHNMRYGQYQTDMLLELSEKYKLNIDLTKLDIDLKDPISIDDLLKQFMPIEEDEVPEVLEGEPNSKLDEVYQLGKHRLMCGDATKIEDVEKLMDGQKADMVFTDPPYGVSYEGGLSNAKKRKGITGDDESIAELFKLSLTNAVMITKDKASFYIFFSFDNKNVLDVLTSVRGAGLRIKALLIWNKTNAGFGSLNHHYKQKHEPLLYCSKENLAEEWYGPNNEVTIWDLNRDGLNEFHPTQKPIALSARAIKNSSKQDDIVFDLFGGSGSTLIACEQTNRTCYMMEISEAYCDVIRKRYDNFINKK